jgi:hypothetical protein
MDVGNDAAESGPLPASTDEAVAHVATPLDADMSLELPDAVVDGDPERA